MFDSFIPGGETKVLAGSRAHSAVLAPLQNMRGLPQSQPEQAGEEGAQPAVHAALAFLLARRKVGVGAFPMARGTTPVGSSCEWPALRGTLQLQDPVNSGGKGSRCEIAPSCAVVPASTCSQICVRPPCRQPSQRKAHHSSVVSRFEWSCARRGLQCSR